MDYIKSTISIDKTIKKALNIKEFVSSFEDYFGREMNEEEKDWVESLTNAADDETEYNHIAYREKPKDIDYEYVPFGKKRQAWLEVVYDAFDEICIRLREAENSDAKVKGFALKQNYESNMMYYANMDIDETKAMLED